MIKIHITLVIATAMLFITSCKPDKKEIEIIYKTSDLSFFNLKGKVKTYAELKIELDQGKSKNFNEIVNKNTLNYQEHFFLENGKLKLVKFFNSLYLNNSLVQVHRTEDSLSIKVFSEKENVVKNITKLRDTLFCNSYYKLDEDSFNFHSEKYKNKIFVKKGEVYLQKAEESGINEKNIYEKWNYIVKSNNKGYDSLIYLSEKNSAPKLLYKVKYWEYDKYGNWLKRQFIKKHNLTNMFFEFTEYRKIEYFE